MDHETLTGLVYEALRTGRESEAIALADSFREDAISCTPDGGGLLGGAVDAASFRLTAFLVSVGADINACRWADRNMLQCAVEMDERGSRCRMIWLLVGLGAETDSRGALGMSALHFAALKGDLASVMALLGCGADPNVADTETGGTPLSEAVRQGHAEMAERLLGAGADAGLQDVYGDSAEALARESGDDRIRFLFRHYVDK